VNAPASGFRLGSRAGVLALVGIAAGIGAAAFWLARLSVRPRAALPRLGAVPAFSLRDAEGRRVGNEDLAGRIWIAAFVPSGCRVCAVRLLRLADLQAATRRARSVRLVTFVTDPDLLRPGALAELAREYGAQPGRWLLLAGSPLPETDRFVVVDGEGRVRAEFREEDPALQSELLDAVGDLLREARR
jgi:protein SCO1/2